MDTFATVSSQPSMKDLNSSQGLPEIDVRAEVISQLRRGRPLGDVAREYRLSVADLCRWIAETASAFEGVTFGGVAPDDDEIRRLRLENEYLRKQRDFYRKAAGIVVVDVLPIDRIRS